MRLDPERQVQAAMAAAQFTIERATRYVEQRIVLDAFADPSHEDLQHAPEGDEILQTLVAVPDPMLSHRLCRSHAARRSVVVDE
jgi:hypothetical protein